MGRGFVLGGEGDARMGRAVVGGRGRRRAGVGMRGVRGVGGVRGRRVVGAVRRGRAQPLVFRPRRSSTRRQAAQEGPRNTPFPLQ